MRKAYGTVDGERLLEILEGHYAGLNVFGVLKFYWDNQLKYHGETFVPYYGETQGGVVSPILFNILVDEVMGKWLTDIMNNITAVIVGLQGDDDGCMFSLFYANGGAIGSKDHEWLQNETQHLCNLFRDCTSLSQILRRLKLWAVTLEQSGDGARWEAINADTKVPEELT